MVLSSKIRNILNASSWYHATTLPYMHNIIKTGLRIDYNKGNELDFGYGFYLTTTEKMAERYITQLSSWYPAGNDEYVVMEYSFMPLDYFLSDSYNTCIFDKFDTRFAEFVFTNRIEGRTGIQRHKYDMVYGVMTDSVPTQLITQYRAGDISKEDVLLGLQKDNSMKQLSIHNQKICDSLELKRVYHFNPVTCERKEIDWYE